MFLAHSDPSWIMFGVVFGVALGIGLMGAIRMYFASKGGKR